MAAELCIDISPELEDFNKHVEVNKNIILSAHFGDGKSYMLQKFKEKYADKYHFVTLYPVNYTIAENKDILEYIKRDIIFQLLRDGLISDTTDFSAVSASLFTAENINDFITDICASKDNSSLIGTGLKVIVKAKEKYDSEKKTAKKLLYNHQNHKGGLYEDDLYTMIIKAGLKYTNKPTVLIVEDLDRVDPSHLFRLLNVLSTQFDRPYIHDDDYRSSNKFGFEKTILVLDYEQTEQLYKYFYGSDIGYQGYMSKLMTTLPYRYDIKEKAQNYLYEFIQKDVGVVSGLECFPRIQMKIEELSVREVVAVLSAKINGFIKVHSINMYDGTPYSTIGGATKLLFYMSLLGFSIEEYSLLLTMSNNKESLVKLFAPFILSDNKDRECFLRLEQVDSNKNNTYSIVMTDNSEIMVSGCASPAYSEPDFSKVLNSAINKVIECTFNKGIKQKNNILED